MFKARGTRSIYENLPGPAPKAEPVVALPTELKIDEPSSPIDPAPATAPPEAIEAPPEAIEAPPEPDDGELATMLGMGFPALPPDFRDRLIAANAGDLEAIQLMREIGQRVPRDLQMAFAEMVHDILAGE